MPLRLTIKQILAWADAHHERTGEWPKKSSGHIWETADDTWNRVNASLLQGWRGLPGGSSLARVLEKHRGVRNPGNLPHLNHKQILGWADAYRARTGTWPDRWASEIPESDGDTWSTVNAALSTGSRGLAEKITLRQLLAKHRGQRNPKRLPRLTVHQILAWADRHHKRTGRWPTNRSGKIEGTAEETWATVDAALRDGIRGMRDRSSLPRLLAKHRRVRNIRDLPDLSVKQILRWCDVYHRRTGRWPSIAAEVIPRSGGETWSGVNHALRHGYRSLPQTTLADLLSGHRGVRNRRNTPRLTKKLIWNWAQHHQQTTGKWPTDASGKVLAEPNESWAAIDMALRYGGRGMPGGFSVSKLLRQHGVKRRSK